MFTIFMLTSVSDVDNDIKIGINIVNWGYLVGNKDMAGMSTKRRMQAATDLDKIIGTPRCGYVVTQ